MEPKPYRYVQVINSICKSGDIITLIGTTDSEDKHNGLDELILRHKRQMYNDGYEVISSSICYMSADGDMSYEKLPM